MDLFHKNRFSSIAQRRRKFKSYPTKISDAIMRVLLFFLSAILGPAVIIVGIFMLLLGTCLSSDKATLIYDTLYIVIVALIFMIGLWMALAWAKQRRSRKLLWGSIVIFIILFILTVTLLPRAKFLKLSSVFLNG